MNKKKLIALVVALQILTLICSVVITKAVAESGFAPKEQTVANVIRGKIVFIGAPIQDPGMADSYIVYVWEESSNSNILRTLLITPETWLFDGEGGQIWEKCLSFDTAVNPYLSAGIEIEAELFAPDDSISDRHVLLYPARSVEILSDSK